MASRVTSTPRKTMLVFSRQSVFPGTGGSEAYSFDFLRQAAAEGWKIQCVITHPQFAGGVPVYRVDPEVFRVMKVHLPGCVRVGHSFIRPSVWLKETGKAFLRKVFPGRFAPRSFRVAWSGRPADAEEQRLAAEWTARLQPDAVLANYCWMAPCLTTPDASRKPVRAVLTHDVMHKKAADFAAQGLADQSVYPGEAMERELLARADVVLAISDEDAAAFRQLLPAAEIHTMLKAARLKQLKGRLPGNVKVGRCLFVGSAYVANVQGLTWFLEQVWPQVRAAVPSAQLRVCGKVCEKIPNPPEGVELLGLCEDLEVEYAAAAAVVVPLLVGSGVKIKLVEALAYGKACVTTTVGVQGLGFLTASEVCVADAAAEFARELTQLLLDETRRVNLEDRAFAAAAEYLAPEKVYTPVLERLGRPA
ncbi:MAG: glycosyltransferase [Chthoniobacteraceae bacterium]